MKKIVVYSGNNCGNCKLAKAHLTEKGYEFEEKNVSENVEFRKELMAKGLMSVPVIDIEGDILVGFNVAQLDALLNK